MAASLDEPHEDLEFSDAQIGAAFASIDFEGRRRITADALMHVLMCNGELVTPAEVDAMIRLAGAPGSGAVTASEFHRIARDPDLPKTYRAQQSGGRAAAAADAVIPRANASATTSTATEHGAVQRQRARALRRILQRFNLRFAQLVRAAEVLKASTQSSSVLDAPALAKLLGLPGDVDDCLQDAVATYATSGVDARQLLLSLCALTDASAEQKIEVAFVLLDTEGAGTLQLPQLLALLAANQLQSDRDAMLPRARMLVSSLPHSAATAVEDARVGREDLRAIVERFPRAVFPPLPDAAEDG